MHKLLAEKFKSQPVYTMGGSFLQLAITERDQRLIALQERWDSLREEKAALAGQDYAAAMKTGVVCRRVRSVKDGKVTKLVEEYEINTALVVGEQALFRGQASIFAVTLFVMQPTLLTPKTTACREVLHSS